MNRKNKFWKISFVLLSVLSLIGVVTYFNLPEEIQHKIRRKAETPYHFLYLHNIDVESILQPRRESMRRFLNNQTKHGASAYIAHGGGIEDFVYTNSKEAVEDSINKGFRFIEIDLHETADGDLIGLHDWHDFARMAGHEYTQEFRNLPVNEIKKMKLKGKYTILSSADICKLMEQNPHIILVTDKIENYELLINRIPYPERMIVEVFSSYHYIKALEAGILYPAYSICKQHHIAELEKYNFPLAVAPAYWFDNEDFKNRIKQLHDNGVTILVFCAPISDQPSFIQNFLGSHISLIYTDKWYPNGPSPLNETNNTRQNKDFP